MKVSRLLATALTRLGSGRIGSTVKPEASSIAVACRARAALWSIVIIAAMYSTWWSEPECVWLLGAEEMSAPLARQVAESAARRIQLGVIRE